MLKNSKILNKYSIKYQLLASYSALSIISSAVTLIICYALLTNLGNESYQSVKQTLDQQAISSAVTVSNEISLALAKQLSVIGQSFSMSGVLYSYLLLNYTKYTTVENDMDTSIFIHQDYYKEYNFKEGCIYPECPEGLGLLGENKKYPYFLEDVYGSLNHTSVYLYSNELKQSVSDDVTWANYYNSSSALRRVINGLTYKDEDFKNTYINSNSNFKDILLYVTVKIEENSKDYLSVRRTFPGIEVKSRSYDPTNTTWFKNAPIDSFDLGGPYEEPFVNKSVFVISSKKFLSYPDFNLTIVDSTVFLISSFNILLNNLNYPNDGFSALLKYDTLEVLQWGQDSTIISTDSVNILPSIYDYEPRMANEDILRTKGTFFIKGIDGFEWLVASQPLLPVSNYGVIASQSSLILLVFSKLNSVREPLRKLQNQINDTTNRVALKIIIISIGILIFNLCIIFWFVTKFVVPLEMIRQKSSDIVKLSLSEGDDNNKDYSAVMNDVTRDVSRRDEVGILALDYIDMISALNLKHLQRGKSNIFMKNPFHNVQYSDNVINKSIINDNTTFTINWDEFSKSMITYFNENKVSIYKQRQLEGEFVNDNDVYINNQSVDADLYVELNGHVHIVASTKTKLAIFSIVILFGLIAVMIVTTYGLYSEGIIWVSSTKSNMITSFKTILDTLTAPKAGFALSFFNQIGLECFLVASYLKSILTYKFTNPEIISQGRFLQSYSIDPYNPYVSPKTFTNQYSLYFSPNDQDCMYDNCTKTHDSLEVKLTSLWDIKTRSLLYPGSSNLFSSLGTNNGLLRDLPVNISTKYSHPVTCFINKPFIPYCTKSYASTSCNPNYKGAVDYPPYDPRCRSWYFIGYKYSEYFQPFFLPPSITVQGYFALYVLANVINDSTLLGVQLSNIDFQQVTSAVNGFSILTNGYCYIISKTNPWTIVSHPFSGTACTHVECAESNNFMSAEEYSIFNYTVLSNFYHNDYDKIPTTYIKNGEIWELSFHTINVVTFPMILLVTVPQKDITEPVNVLNLRIYTTLNNMIIAFVLATFAFLLMFIYLVSSLINNIVVPINQLRETCVKVINNEEINFSQIHAHSLDMEILLKAFSNLLDIFQSGYDSFVNQDYDKSKALLTNSLNLFQSVNHEKNIAVSENNLGCIELSIGNFQSSDYHYNQSIKYYSLVIQKCNYDIDKSIHYNVISSKSFNLQLNLSQVYYNKCMLYLSNNQLKLCNNIMQQQLDYYIKTNFIFGKIYMLNIKGYYYYKKHLYIEANEQFNLAYNELQIFENSEFDSFVSPEVIHIAKQLTLYNLAIFYDEVNKISDIFINENIEYRYVQSLVFPEYVDKQMIQKIFYQLSYFFMIKGRESDTVLLESITDKFFENNAYNYFKADSIVSKQIIFCLDYSINNNLPLSFDKLKDTIYNHVNDYDDIMLMHFNKVCTVDIDFKKKKEFIAQLHDSIESLNQPSGKSYLYDAINECIDKFEPKKSNHDWMVVICGGGDERSNITKELLKEKLSRSTVNLIIIDVNRIKSKSTLNDLRMLCESKKSGLFIHPTSEIKSISHIFGKSSSPTFGMIAFQDY